MAGEKTEEQLVAVVYRIVHLQVGIVEVECVVAVFVTEFQKHVCI